MSINPGHFWSGWTKRLTSFRLTLNWFIIVWSAVRVLSKNIRVIEILIIGGFQMWVISNENVTQRNVLLAIHSMVLTSCVVFQWNHYFTSLMAETQAMENEKWRACECATDSKRAMVLKNIQHRQPHSQRKQCRDRKKWSFLTSKGGCFWSSYYRAHRKFTAWLYIVGSDIFLTSTSSLL